jgi:nitrate reductase (cytochrome), electron transfer subunit
MTFRSIVILLCFVLTMPLAALVAGDNLDNLRGKTPLTEEGPAPRLAPERNTDMREVRNYPEQPPVIPHEIEDYTIDLRSNKCLSCHARARTAESQAPMVSITHFMDRDGQFRASITARRYFCTQCHVPQHDVENRVRNEFVDVDSLVGQTAPKKD